MSTENDIECNREELLANFQACTGIDDVGEALTHLEQSDWNLLEAVNRVMADQWDTPAAADISSHLSARDHNIGGETGGRHNNAGASIDGATRASVFSQPNSSNVPLKVLFQGNTIELCLPADETVSTLRLVLHAHTDVPPYQQELCVDGRRLDDPQRRLCTVSATASHTITLTAQPTAAVIDGASSGRGDHGDESTSRPLPVPSTSSGGGWKRGGSGGVSGRLQLTVDDLDSGRRHTLSVASDYSVGQIKTDTYNLTDTPARLQVWTGWPPGTTDKTLVCQSGIDPDHHFTVARSTNNDASSSATNSGSNNNSHNNNNNHGQGKSSSTSGQDNNTCMTVDLASDTSSVEYQDASEIFDDGDDDAMFVGMRRPARLPLVPDNNEDELAGVLHFCEQFETRYGPCQPPFYHGTLAQAADEACAKPLSQRRLLAVYLHHDDSVLANVFCSHVLCSESVSTLLTTNFVCWGWDITFPANQDSLMRRVSAQFGGRTADALLHTLDQQRLPALVLLMRSRSSTELVSALHANCSLDELMAGLLHALDLFAGQVSAERREHSERCARESVKLEQDLAYEASLLADRAKEEVRRAEREEQQRQEADERRERERQENIKQQEEAVREAMRLSLRSSLPSEPGADTPADLATTIRFRSPGGATFVRRFLVSDSLQVLLNYVIVQGYPIEEYKLISSWPRKDLTTCDKESSLEQLKLFPQETLMLQER